MSYEVFISHSSKDKLIADACCAVLESKGIRCWIAPRDVVGGLDWPDQIVDAINKVKMMVLVYTAHSNSSRQVKREVERGVSRGIPIIPIRVENVPLSKHMEYFISTPHWLDALTPPLEAHLDHLAETVKRVLEQIDTEPKPNVEPTDETRSSVEPPVIQTKYSNSWMELETGLLQRIAPIFGISPNTFRIPPRERLVVGGLVAVIVGLLGLAGNMSGLVRVLNPEGVDLWFFETFVLFRPVNIFGAILGVVGNAILTIGGRRILALGGGGRELTSRISVVLGGWAGIWMILLAANVLSSNVELPPNNGIILGMFKLVALAWAQLGLVWFLVRPK